jgi:hypothetical protein
MSLFRDALAATLARHVDLSTDRRHTATSCSATRWQMGAGQGVAMVLERLNEPQTFRINPIRQMPNQTLGCRVSPWSHAEPTDRRS